MLIANEFYKRSLNYVGSPRKILERDAQCVIDNSSHF